MWSFDSKQYRIFCSILVLKCVACGNSSNRQSADDQDEPQEVTSGNATDSNLPSVGAIDANSITDANNSNMVIVTGSVAAADANFILATYSIPSQPSLTLRGASSSVLVKSTSRQLPGTISFAPVAGESIVRFDSTTWVPKEFPPKTGSLFIWPGLQPSASIKPFGVLQPVLIWGPVCTSSITKPPAPFSTWWIAGFYVSKPNCYAGEGLTLSQGTPVRMSMALEGNVWHQTMVDLVKKKSVTFDYDLQGQPQAWPIFRIETQNANASLPVFAADLEITYAKPLAKLPSLEHFGQNDGMSDPILSPDKRTMSIKYLVLRGPGTK